MREIIEWIIVYMGGTILSLLIIAVVVAVIVLVVLEILGIHEERVVNKLNQEKAEDEDF